LRALKRAQEANRNSGGGSDFGEAAAAFGAQAPQARADRRPCSGAAGGRFDGAFALQHLHDGGSVQSADLAQVARFFQQAHVGIRIKTITARGAVRASQAQSFPSADGRGRNSHQTGHVTDFEIDFGVARHDLRMGLLVAP